MPAIAFRNVTKAYASSSDKDAPAAVRNITFDVEEGEIVVLLGPSGCGKTTLMRMVNRLIEPTSGRILLGGEDIESLPATQLRRRIGYVIQQVGLFPHMSVESNVGVVPHLLGWPKSKISARVDELLELVDLPPAHYRKRYPRQLSGGQQQRVGIARAMAADPAVMLMDEPFGAIDAITRGDLQNELLRIQRKVAKTVLFVTHDVEEALRLADRIAVMRTGEVVQYDTPVNLLSRPADEFVATLLDAEDVFRHLSLIPVSSRMHPEPDLVANGTAVREDDNLRHALSLMIGHGTDQLLVLDAGNRPTGRIRLEAILAEGDSQIPDGQGEISPRDVVK